LPRDAYRVLGYRQCGERAVRVDILERLADLIRPALAWKETSPGEKPAGAFDGRGFVVTQAMTSLTGSAGEDFASILRALGYRMDRRSPLPEKPVEKVETAVEPLFQQHFVEAMAIPHKTAPYPNLRKAVVLPAPKEVGATGDDGGRRRRRRSG
jgi:ATP-dependent RNA helicase SUPV3L1/SUV3